MMCTSLRRAIESGDYLVDPDAVADAILRRAIARTRAALGSSEVLVAAQPGASPAAEAPELDAVAPDHPA